MTITATLTVASFLTVIAGTLIAGTTLAGMENLEMNSKTAGAKPPDTIAADTGTPLMALSNAERAAGWKLYSGADATTLWRGYKMPKFPSKGWKAEGGVLSISKGGGGGDLITDAKFGDLEMTWSFKLGEKANSGVMYRVAETNGATYETGPEYQLLDDGTFAANPTDPHSCGALYDLYNPAEGKVMNPAGQWNQGRIYLRNGVLQHWLNGRKVVEAKLFDDAGKPTAEWAAKIAGSKFKDMKGFGVMPSGHLAFQDHGDTEIALKDIKIRDLASGADAGAVNLFNGKDMTGFKTVLSDGGKAEDVWSVKDGVLICKGNPVGYFRTEKDYTNYVLKLEWRFDPKKGPGNSGVLLRMVGPDTIWPKSVEAQLQSGAAGDFWNIEEVKMTTEKSRLSGRNAKRDPAAGAVERPIGEWNEYEIIVDKGTIILKVNGVEVNRATDVEIVPGKICFQSEGAEIHFRNIRLVPLD